MPFDESDIELFLTEMSKAIGRLQRDQRVIARKDLSVS
jgi:hypothetical protein